MSHANTVDLKITRSDRALVVRFQRLQWSSLLQRDFQRTDLVFAVPPEQEQAVRADFEFYRHLDDAAQRRWLRRLNSARYAKRARCAQSALF